jgi:hypothetical protein
MRDISRIALCVSVALVGSVILSRFCHGRCQAVFDTTGQSPDEMDELIDQASEESFPASDPPARTPVTGTGQRSQ